MAREEREDLKKALEEAQAYLKKGDDMADSAWYHGSETDCVAKNLRAYFSTIYKQNQVIIELLKEQRR